MADSIYSATTTTPYYPSSTSAAPGGTSGTDMASNLQQLVNQGVADSAATSAPAFGTSSFQPAGTAASPYPYSAANYGPAVQSGYGFGNPYQAAYNYGFSPYASGSTLYPASASTAVAAAKSGSGSLSPTVAMATVGAYKAWRSPPKEAWASRDLDFLNRKLFGGHLPTGLQEKINARFQERLNPSSDEVPAGKKPKKVKDLPQAKDLIEENQLKGNNAAQLRKEVADAELNLQKLQDETAIHRAETGVKQAELKEEFRNLRSTATSYEAEARVLDAGADAEAVRRENLPKRNVIERRRLARKIDSKRTQAKKLNERAEKARDKAAKIFPNAKEQASANAWKLRKEGDKVGADFRKDAIAHRGHADVLEQKIEELLSEKTRLQHTVENLRKEHAPIAKVKAAEQAVKANEKLAETMKGDAALVRASAKLADAQASLLERLPVKEAKTIEKIFHVKKEPVEEGRGLFHFLGRPFRKVARLPGVSHSLEVLRAIAPEMAVVNGMMDFNRMTHDWSDPKASLTKKLLAATAVAGDGVGAAFWGEGLGFVGDGISLAAGYEHGKVK